MTRNSLEHYTPTHDKFTQYIRELYEYFYSRNETLTMHVRPHVISGNQPQSLMKQLHGFGIKTARGHYYRKTDNFNWEGIHNKPLRWAARKEAAGVYR